MKKKHIQNNCPVCRDHFGEKEKMSKNESPLEELLVRESEIAASGGSSEMAETKQKSEGKYSLPEEQQTEEAKEAEEEENLPAIMQEAFEMEEEMVDIRDRTNNDGTVVGYVEKIHYTKKNGTIAVDVDLPAEPDLERFHFKKPKNWTREWRWVRFVDAYVGGPDRIANFIDMTEAEQSIDLTDGDYNGEKIDVKVKRLEDDYEIVMPMSYPDVLYKASRLRYGLSEQGHPVWKAIPTVAGLYSAFTFQIAGFLPDFVEFAASGIMGFITVGMMILIGGAVFFQWDDN